MPPVELAFDAEAHAYFMEGHRVPGVSQIIRPLMPFQGNSEAARDRGSRVHEACEQLDAGFEPDIEEGDEPYVEAYQRFLSETGCEIRASELKIGHPQYRYAGRLDRLVVLHDELMVIDLKTSRNIERWMGVQQAAYAHALRAMFPKEYPKPPAYTVVQLRDDGRYDASKKFGDPVGDWDCFIGLLKVHTWKEKGR